MADKCDVYLIIFFSILKGTTGDTHVFRSFGENVILPCKNVLSDCTSTTWIYNRHRHEATTELFAGGIKKNNVNAAERLSLGSDCSLNIYKATEEDYGEYTCQQYVEGRKHANDTRVYLLVLQVSSPSTKTEKRPGDNVTLHCRLFTHHDLCDSLVRFKHIHLLWENQAGVNLQKDSRYQISQKSCISTLTTTLLNEDNNKKWKCLVKKSNEIKTSASYTVKFRDPSDTNPPVTPTEASKTSETEGIKNCLSLYRVIIAIVEVAVFAAPTVILLQIICAGPADNRRRTQTT